MMGGDGRLKTWLIVLIPATLIVILLAYLLGSHAIPQSVQDNLANAAIPPDTSGLPDDNLAGALPEAASNVQPAAPLSDTAATPSPDNGVTNDAAPAPTDTSDDAEAEAQARREVTAAVRNATERALDGGEAAHWHKDGLSGDIVVSEPQDDGSGGSCRTVTATMGASDDDRGSRAITSGANPQTARRGRRNRGFA